MNKHIPFFCHHEDALHQDTLGNLRRNTLEKTKPSLVLNNELHNLNEAVEGLALSRCWGLRLEANLGDNQGLRGDSRKRLRHGSEHCIPLLA